MSRGRVFYDAAFYDTIRPGVQSSARIVVPMVMRHIGPRTVIDVGCGEGWWAQTFADCGCDVLGIDGAYVESSPLGDRFLPYDLTQPFVPPLAHVDLAVCLEVAEHLPATRAASLIEDLCTVAPVVLFSAAMPGQGGTGHINEQPIRYWVDLFHGCGMAVSGALRWAIWDDPAVENWYASNCLVAAREPEAYPGLFDTPLATPWQVVHPVLFDARRL
jgi:hypothetical protein